MSLAGNTEKLNSLIAAINALPEAGSGGGGAALGTCTVTVRGPSSGYRATGIAYTSADADGNVSSQRITNSSAASVTLENVVCGSYVAVTWQTTYTATSSYTTTNAELFHAGGATYNCFEITAESGGTADIYNYSSSGVQEPE